LWKITSKEDEKYDANDIVYYPDLNKIIPGDIIYYSGHVMMVADVKYEPGTRNTTVSQIKIIEATTWEVYFVSKLHSLDRYSGGINNADKNWVIGRLK